MTETECTHAGRVRSNDLNCTDCLLIDTRQPKNVQLRLHSPLLLVTSDLYLRPMILIYELNLDIVKVHTKNM